MFKNAKCKGVFTIKPVKKLNKKTKPVLPFWKWLFIVYLKVVHWSNEIMLLITIYTFTFTHLADAFIQSDLHCIQVTVFNFFFLSALLDKVKVKNSNTNWLKNIRLLRHMLACRWISVWWCSPFSVVAEVDDGGQSEGCSGQERLISNQESIQLFTSEKHHFH